MAQLVCLLSACTQAPSQPPDPFTTLAPVELPAGLLNEGTGPRAASATKHYVEQVQSAVMQKWTQYRLMHRGKVTFGSIETEFYVNEDGEVEEVKIVNATRSYEALTLWTLQAIRDAEIPSMPFAVARVLPKSANGRLKIELNCVIY